MGKIIRLGVVVVGGLGLLVGATFAALSDAEVVAGNVFSAGTLNLVMGGSDPAISPLVTVGNIKPGDTNSGTPIVLNLTNAGSVHASIHLTLLSTINDSEGEMPEAESDKLGTPGRRLSDKLLFSIKDASNNTLWGPQPIRCFNDNAGGMISCTNPIIGPFFNLGSLAAGQTKTFKLIYTLPTTVGNDVMGDITAFNIQSTLVQ